MDWNLIVDKFTRLYGGYHYERKYFVVPSTRVEYKFWIHSFEVLELRRNLYLPRGMCRQLFVETVKFHR